MTSSSNTPAPRDPRSFVERNPLARVTRFGVRTAIHNALDRAAETRTASVIVGPAGIGKTSAGSHALNWFHAREKERWGDGSSGYARRRVHLIANADRDKYEGVLEAVLRLIDRREPTAARGRKKTPEQLRQRIAELAFKRKVVAVIIDEAEVLTEVQVDALRDLMTVCAAEQRKRQKDPTAEGVVGIGIVFVGTEDALPVLSRHREWGERIASFSTLDLLSIADATAVLDHWIPQSGALSPAERRAFEVVVRTNICRTHATTMRHLADVVREYARRLENRQVIGTGATWTDVPIDINELASAGDDTLPPQSGGPGGRPS